MLLSVLKVVPKQGATLIPRLMSTKTSSIEQPLRIAYFGSDRFSLLSLGKLLDYQKLNPNRILSIDVITRSKKKSGRKLKNLTDVPIGHYAEDHSMVIHRADTASDILGLSESQQYDLAIAVSYGILIPAKFLKSLRYGGLNVHPSLLPKYSGSSPIQYALMNDDLFSGVTVQTLHPTKFDRGDIVSQSDEIPISNDDNYTSMEEKLGNIGADLLVKTIENELFLPPIDSPRNNYPHSLASKMSSSSSEINWSLTTSRQIKRLLDALGSVHTYVSKYSKSGSFEESLKVILYDIEEVSSCNDLSMKLPGDSEVVDGKLFIKTIDGYISTPKLKLQYCNEESIPEFIPRIPKRLRSTEKILKFHAFKTI